MACLSIRLLGSFEVTLDDRTVTQFESDKVRALLAYLATKANQPHRRETLAGLLWPEMPENTARANLRYALANLRSAIEDRDADPPFLLVTRPTIQLNLDSDVQVDVLAFSQRLGQGQIRGQTIQELEDAVDLVRGEFMEGFGLRDSLPFEEWLLLEREHLARLRLSALHRLTAFHRAQGTYGPALRYAWQQVALEPYEEEAQQQLIHLLAVTGQRSAALAQYESLRQLLVDELGIEPSSQTHRLYRQILSGEIEPEEEALRDQIIRGYDLLEQIGAGTFGAVYRAYQPVLGRQVAVKVIRPEFANRPSFIRRFEAEAQMVARLEHLHIVPLYDYWREPEGAYLVMRLFPAGSLQDSLAHGPWELKATARVVDQIASALAAAHRQGVIHRDVKPANIMLDGAGNAYLSDFSIARDVAAIPNPALPATLTVSPEYAAPEQWQRVPLTTAVDLYSLGMVLHELLAGAHPYAGATLRELRDRHCSGTLPPVTDARPEVPPAVNDVVCRATAKSARDRYPDASALAQAFRQALEPDLGRIIPAVEIPRPEPENPFKGLRPFLEADAVHFFGRDALIQQLVGRLGEARQAQEEPPRQAGTSSAGASPHGPGGNATGFLAVVGPSGSGKSSVVRAGLIPALRSGALPGSENWFVATMQPGTAPLAELAVALMGVAVRGVEGLAESLERDERGLLRAAEMVLPDWEAEPSASDADMGAFARVSSSGDADQCTLLLVVDQFEELYAPAVEPSEREQFLQLLYAAAMEPESRLCIVITLRADFYDRPLRHPQISQLLRERTEIVIPLSTGELTEAIRGPADQAGVELEPGLLHEVVDQVAEQPGALPMFQYALTELFERRAGRRLTWEAFRDIGGVTGAVARRAEEVYADLDDAGKAMARQVFLRLVTPGDPASEASATPETRRRVLLAELRALRSLPTVEQPPEQSDPSVGGLIVDRVLDVFGRARLLLFDRDPSTRAPTVEVAHEALLGAWRRLAAWLQESWADLRMERLLSVATGEWLEADRDPGFLLRGTRLAQFEVWAVSSSVALTRDEEALLEASLAAKMAREAEREARRQRELDAARALAEEQTRRADAERQRAQVQAEGARRLRRRALYLAGALLVALVLAVAAGLFGQQARLNANLAATRQAEAEAETSLRATAQDEAEEEADLRATAQVQAEEEADLRATAQIEAEEEAGLRATAESIAVDERQVADERARIATSRELAAAAQNAVNVDPELAVLLALEAVSTGDSGGGERSAPGRAGAAASPPFSGTPGWCRQACRCLWTILARHPRNRPDGVCVGSGFRPGAAHLGCT